MAISIKKGMKSRGHAPVPRLSKNPASTDLLTPRQVQIPAEPLYGEDDAALRDEQQVMRVEILMTKGVRSPQQLMALLGITSKPKMDRFIKRVHARWELGGTSQEFARHRGESFVRLDLIESELWSTASNTEDERVKQVALKNIIDLQAQRQALLGLTPKVIERLTTQGAEGTAFSRRVQTHERLSLVAQRMLTLIEQRTGMQVLEHGEEKTGT